jgi:hypothetical protein
MILRDHIVLSAQAILTSFILTLAGLSGLAFADDPTNPISATGGHYFDQRVELPVADFAQDDPRWAQQFLGPTRETLGDEGCTLTSIAMVLNYYHVRCDPSILNRFLTGHGGYDDEGFLDFDRVTKFAPDRIQLAYQGNPSYAALDHSLLLGHPVIVQLTLYSGDRHFVVVMGKQGLDYLVRDPAAYPASSLVKLKRLAPRIEQQVVYLSRQP